MIVEVYAKQPDCIYRCEHRVTGSNGRPAGDFKLRLPCSCSSQETAMTFADIATTHFFPLHRLHKPVVVTKDGMDQVDGLLTGPVALADGAAGRRRRNAAALPRRRPRDLRR